MAEEMELRLEKSLHEDIETRSLESQAVIRMLRMAILMAESQLEPEADAPADEQNHRPWFRRPDGVVAVREAIINQAEALFGHSERWTGYSHQRAQRLRDLQTLTGREEVPGHQIIDELIEQAIEKAKAKQ